MIDTVCIYKRMSGKQIIDRGQIREAAWEGRIRHDISKTEQGVRTVAERTVRGRGGQ